MMNKCVNPRNDSSQSPPCKKEENKVIAELREKARSLKFRLLDSRNQNQMLRKELLKIQALIEKEQIQKPDDSCRCHHQQLKLEEQQNKAEEVQALKERVDDLQNRIRQLENLDQGDCKKKQPCCKEAEIKTSRQKELFECCVKLKRKIECWRGRSQDLQKEVDKLRFELGRLQQKGTEHQEAQHSYSYAEKELQGLQNERLELRCKLNMSNIKNKQLSEEVAALKEDIHRMRSKISDDDKLIEALTSQQQTFQDLISREKLIGKEKHRTYVEGLKKIYNKFATARNQAENIWEMSRQDDQMAETLKDETPLLAYIGEEDETDEETLTITSTGSTLQVPPDSPQIEDEPESDHLDEDSAMKQTLSEYEQFRPLFLSVHEEVNQFLNAIHSNHNRVNEWGGQQIQVKIQNCEKKAEIRRLEVTLARLERAAANKNSKKNDNKDDLAAMTTMLDLLQRENKLFQELKSLMVHATRTFLKTYIEVSSRTTKLFVDALGDIYRRETNEFTT